MDEESAQVFLPPHERCFERLRLARFGETVTCVHCGDDAVVKRGTRTETQHTEQLVRETAVLRCIGMSVGLFGLRLLTRPLFLRHKVVQPLTEDALKQVLGVEISIHQHQINRDQLLGHL